MIKLILSIYILLSSEILFAGIFSDEAPFFLILLEKFLSPLALGWISVISSLVFGVMITARALSEILSLFADKTSTNIDNQVIVFSNRVFVWASKIVGWFGVGQPTIFKNR